MEPIDLVTRAYNIVADRDIESFITLLAPDFESSQTDVLPWGGVHRGHDQVRAFFRNLYSHIDARLEVARLVEAGPAVVAVGKTRGKVRATGKAFECDLVHIWTVVNQLAQRLEIYIDTPQMLRALRP